MLSDTASLIDSIGPPCRGLFISAHSIVDHFNTRRKTPRTPLIAPCCIVPIDSHLKPNGKLYTGVTTDISTTGLGLLCTEFIDPQLLLVGVSIPSVQSLQFIVDVVRCDNVNDYFKIGAKLVQKIDPTNSPILW